MKRKEALDLLNSLPDFKDGVMALPTEPRPLTEAEIAEMEQRARQMREEAYRAGELYLDVPQHVADVEALAAEVRRLQKRVEDIHGSNQAYLDTLKDTVERSNRYANERDDLRAQLEAAQREREDYAQKTAWRIATTIRDERDQAIRERDADRALIADLRRMVDNGDQSFRATYDKLAEARAALESLTKGHAPHCDCCDEVAGFARAALAKLSAGGGE